MLRPARESELADILTLLSSAALPVSGVVENIDNFVVFESGETVAGIGGLELYGDFALLRSVAVAPAYRGRGIGAAVCKHLESAARRTGVKQLFILTETAQAYFSSRGYAVIPRTDAPQAIRSTDEFTTLCSPAAVVMLLSIAPGYRGP